MMTDLSPTLTVAHNPWFLCAVLLTLRILGVGFAWSWVVPTRQPMAGTAVAALLGVTINALSAMLLAELGFYSPSVEATLLVTLAIGGFVAGRKRLPLPGMLPGTAASCLVFVLVMALPHRGEWIAGGWDPGIYVCQGVAVSQGHDATPDPDQLLSRLSPQELTTFTRRVHGYTEYLPVVPVDPESRRVQPFFFRLTPSWVAVLYRCGGLRAATRMNLFLAWPVILLFGALLWSWTPRIPHLVAGLGLLILHPVWLFMLNFPTSEMLQLMLVLGLVVARPHSLSATALLLFAATTNRFSFLPFAGLLLCAQAWIGSPKDSLPARLGLVLACAAGAGFDYACCRVTLVRLDELVPPLVIAGSALLAISLGIGDRLRNLLTGPRLAILLLLTAAGMLTVDFATGSPHVALRRNFGDALPFLGPLLCLAGLAGWSQFGRWTRHQQGILLFLAGASLATLTVAAIAPLYPWALRRHLVYTLPLLAGPAAALFLRGWDHSTRLPVRIGLVAAICAVIGTNAPRAVRALSRTEFNGLSSVLALAAAQLHPNDVVVADHFRWGTPLHMLHQAPVLNGERIWQEPSPERTEAALHALRRLHQGGRRIVLFTSTEPGARVFPGKWGRIDQIWSSGPWRLRDLNHHADADDFIIRERTKVFALYVWAAETSIEPDPPGGY